MLPHKKMASAFTETISNKIFFCFFHCLLDRGHFSLWWPCLFIFVGWGLGISTFRSPINILPIAASSFVTISLWLDNPRLTKLISLPVCTAFFVYDLSISSYVGMVNESLSIFSIALSFIKEGKQI